MKSFAKHNLLLIIIILINPFCVSAQEENTAAVTQGNKYISLRIKSLEKYNSRIEHQQKRLLRNLKNKERRFVHKLQKSDSLAYARYKEQTSPSYDSISKISNSDTGATAASFSRKKNSTVDSLRGVQSFVQNKSGLPTNSPEMQSTSADLNQLQGKLNFRNYITQLITQRTNELKNFAGSEASNIPGLKGIEKQLFYGKAKMKVFKEMEDEPVIAEDKAMEYLQGTSGFDKYLKNSTPENTMMGGNKSSDIEEMTKMGFQTKGLLQKNFAKMFGTDVSKVSKQLSGSLQQFREKQKDVSTIKEAKQSLSGLSGTQKPSFKVNPMRCLPFWKRVQQQYSWQTTKADQRGEPALIEIGATMGYRHSPCLTYGLGTIVSFGLGQNWQEIHFSFQGFGFRNFVSWEWQYGMGLYADYERIYKKVVFGKDQRPGATDVSQSAHNSKEYIESVMIGITKSYKVSSKWNGQMQLLYDIWWREKGLNTPIVLRFTTMKK